MTTKLALQVTPAGVVTELDISSNSFSVLQTAVDGWIEAVDINDTLTMWVNEEGLLRNDLALNLIGKTFYSSPIMGTIVFTGGTNSKGDTLGLNKATAEAVRRVCANFVEMLNLVSAE